MVSNLFRVLRLWYGKGDERLSYSELLGRKNSDKELSRKSERQFIRYLNSLVKMNYLKKDPDLSRTMWYSQTEEARRKSFTILLSDFAEHASFHENRDLFGASIIYSQPALTDFMTEEQIEELYTILDEANVSVVCKIEERLMKKRTGELPTSERENVVFYSRNIKIFDEMTRRLEESGVVKTREEDRKLCAKLLGQAKRKGFDTIEEFKNKLGSRSHRKFRHYPLTFEEEKEYQDLKNKLHRASAEAFFAKIENEMPRIFCCLYNFAMEEFLLSELDLALCFDGIIRPIDEVLESLSKKQLKEYKTKIEKTLRSKILRPPKWTENNDNLRPKMSLSWDNITARKYLHRILISVEKKLTSEDS